MRRLDPDRLLGEIYAAVHNHGARTDELLRFDVVLLHPDRAVSLIQRFAGRRPVVDHVRSAVIVEEERRVDAVEARKPDRIGPRSGRVFRRHDEVAAGVDERADHVVRPVVIANRRREQAARDAGAIELELRRTIEDVPQLRPVDEILALKDRQSGEVREARRDEVVVLADANHARIGVESGENRIRVPRWTDVGVAIHGIVALVREPIEPRLGRRGRPPASRHAQPERWAEDGRDEPELANVPHGVLTGRAGARK